MGKKDGGTDECHKMISRGIHILVDEMFFYLAVGACLSDVFFADGPLVVLWLFLRTCVDGKGSLGGYIGGQAGWLARGGRESRLNRGDDKIRLRFFQARNICQLLIP